MANSQKVLLVDIGNTRIKYCFLENAHIKPTVCDDLTSFLTTIKQLSCTHIYVASVRKDESTKKIQAVCDSKHISLTEICTEKNAFGVKNSYADESKMGVDRWLAMICAQEKTKKAFFVMDVGTAITVDFVASGQHLGGWIIPGFHTMKDSLIKSTQKVVADDHFPSEFSVGTDTEDCVAMGCYAALRGVYLAAVDYISSKQTEFDVIIGGGDKKVFAFLESGDSILAANLVVQGLARYAKRDLSVTFD